MSNIGGLTGSSSASMYSGMSGMQRPDPAQMAKDLFSKLDSKGQGYLEKSDLQTAFDKVSDTKKSGSTSNIDALFKQMDGDSDGKITQQEMTETLTKITSQIDSQMTQMRMSGSGISGNMGGPSDMPPPPPPGPEGTNEGFTKDELTSIAEDTEADDSNSSNLISQLANNFDSADTNHDGKVSGQEAMAFSQKNEGDTANVSNNQALPSSRADTSLSEQIAKQIMQLVQAYGQQGNDASETLTTSTLSVTA